jgi:alkylhydroperoxidase/carboxymuconolactone decarboxylase family protein YurZ
MNTKNPLQTFVDECPEVQQAYAGFINSLIAMKGLDNKTKQLIYIAIKIITNDLNAVRLHVPMAKSAGATREEIKSVVLLCLTAIGLKAVSEGLPLVLDSYDNC